MQNPHIITLLYFGGNILARKKTSYEDILKSERLNQVVKEMMQEQHKGMLRDLKAGSFDERLFGTAPAPAEEIAPIQAPSPTPAPAAPRPPAAAAPTQPKPTVPPPPGPPRPAAPAAPLRPATPPASVPKPPPAQQVAAPPPPPPPPTGKIIELSDDVELKDEDIFGADLISDKSLDEVILNYLAQNIEEE